MALKIIGIEKLTEKIEEAKKVTTPRKAAGIYLAAARVIRDEARRRAPRGRHPIRTRKYVNSKGENREVRWVPGTLKKSIRSWLSKSRAKTKPIVAYTMVNLFKGYTRAPHGHLVEFGTTARKPRKAKLMVFPSKSGRKWVSAKTTAPSPARKYFSSAVAAKSTAALEAAAEKHKQIMDKALRS